MPTPNTASAAGSGADELVSLTITFISNGNDVVPLNCVGSVTEYEPAWPDVPVAPVELLATCHNAREFPDTPPVSVATIQYWVLAERLRFNAVKPTREGDVRRLVSLIVPRV
jgi:hypothetical protein